MDWYASLAKPAWAPESWVFGAVWSVLYPIIAVTFAYVVFRVLKGDAPASVLIPIGINVITNLAFTPIMFGRRDLLLAEIDILVVLITIVWAMIALWPHARIASLALSPYLVWVGIATALQTSITLMNR